MAAPAPLRPRTAPPARRLAASLPRPDKGPLARVRVRAPGFLAGWGGLAVALAASALAVALLVGWVLLWVRRPGGPSIALLTLGSMAFVALVGVLVLFALRIRVHARLRNAEAAFLTAVSHHLRTPLAGIRAAAQTLERPGLDDARRDALLAAILRESARLSRLVDNILEMGRLDVEGTRFRAERVDLGAVAEDAVDGLRLAADAAGDVLDLAVAGPCVVRGDRDALGLLVGNLVDNALKHGRRPGEAARVAVSVAAVGAFAVVQVLDAGPGLGEADPERLFRRFTRGGEGDRPGSGLGLALARAIARGHGGDVRLAGDAGGSGAAAEAWLPLAPAAAEG